MQPVLQPGTGCTFLRRVRRVRRVRRCNRFCNRAQGAQFCDAFDAFDAFDDATGFVTGHWVHISATRSTCSTTLIFQNHTNAELLVLVTPLHPLHHVPKPHECRKCVCVCVCVCVCKCSPRGMHTGVMGNGEWGRVGKLVNGGGGSP